MKIKCIFLHVSMGLMSFVDCGPNMSFYLVIYAGNAITYGNSKNHIIGSILSSTYRNTLQFIPVPISIIPPGILQSIHEHTGYSVCIGLWGRCSGTG